METVHIEDVANRIIGRLSKGYRQRVGLAQALVNDPPVLVLDEPTVGLDPKQIHEVRELIREWKGKHTVILSTHILPEVEQTCNRVVIIDRGRIVAVDTPANLVDQLRGTHRIVVDVEGPVEAVTRALSGVPGVGRVQDMASNGARARFEVEAGDGDGSLEPVLARTVVENGWGLYGMESSRMSLEDIFLKLTTADDRAEGPGPVETAGEPAPVEDPAPGDPEVSA
jgi:ABC-2 type transport system ATP-binding protein